MKFYISDHTPTPFLLSSGNFASAPLLPHPTLYLPPKFQKRFCSTLLGSMPHRCSFGDQPSQSIPGNSLLHCHSTPLHICCCVCFLLPFDICISPPSYVRLFTYHTHPLSLSLLLPLSPSPSIWSPLRLGCYLRSLQPCSNP